MPKKIIISKGQVKNCRKLSSVPITDMYIDVCYGYVELKFEIGSPGRIGLLSLSKSFPVDSMYFPSYSSPFISIYKKQKRNRNSKLN